VLSFDPRSLDSRFLALLDRSGEFLVDAPRRPFRGPLAADGGSVELRSGFSRALVAAGHGREAAGALFLAGHSDEERSAGYG
jgi:hypothetical protein